MVESMEREPTEGEWLDFHRMILESKALLSKDRQGQYSQVSIRSAKSAVKSALSWIKALQH